MPILPNTILVSGDAKNSKPMRPDTINVAAIRNVLTAATMVV